MIFALVLVLIPAASYVASLRSRLSAKTNTIIRLNAMLRHEVRKRMVLEKCLALYAVPMPEMPDEDDLL
jgi:hypothetical protein